MKPFCILFLILVVLISVSFAQMADNPPCDPKPEAVNFYELGTTTKPELKSRLEEYFKKLTAEPDSQGYIINYGSDREVARREKIIRESIIFCKHDPSRITLVRGGNERILKTELWIVPPGADYPISNHTETLNTDSVNNIVRVVKTIKADSLGCQTTETIIRTGKIDIFGKVRERYFNWTLEHFIKNLEFDKTFKGYILIYGNDEEINNIETKIRNLEFVKNFADKRLIFIKGGFRKETMTELWIMPEGTEPPKP